MRLVTDVRALLAVSPDTARMLALTQFDDFSELAGALFTSLTGNATIGQAVASAYRADTALVEMTGYDIEETARRNFEPGGPPASFLFSRGVQAVIAHRVAHKLWRQGEENLAHTLKTICGHHFSTDIHPAAKIGAGFWLDHGLGFVAGETCIIEEDVSIWHNVTLGSTLNDDGPSRHPHVGPGVVIGAGAILLGAIKIGAGANIGAGAIVVDDVADRSLVVGTKAQAVGRARISFANRGGSK